MSGNEMVEMIRSVFEWAALLIEVLGAGIIVAGVIKVAITRGTIRYLFQLAQPGAYENYKHQLGKTLLLGLEFLVAADVVRTVALEPTLTNVAVLGLLVLIGLERRDWRQDWRRCSVRKHTTHADPMAVDASPI